MKPLDPRLLRYARHARTYILFLAVSGLVSACLVIAQSMLIAGAASPVIEGRRAFASLLPLVGTLAAVMVARALITYLTEAFGHRAAVRVIADLRAQTLRHCGDLGGRWLASGRTSSTVTLVTSALGDLEPYFVNFLPQLILTATVTPLALAVILSLDLISAVAIVICIPLIPIFMILIGKMTQSYSTARLKAMQRLGNQLLDLLAGLTTLKALGREQGPRRRVKRLGEDYANTTMQTLYVAFLSGAALEFLATLSTALVAVEVGLRMVGGNLSLFEGLTVIMLTPEVFKPLREVGSQFHASADGVAACERIFEILDTPLPAPAGSTFTKDPGTKNPDMKSPSTNVSATLPPGAILAPAARSNSSSEPTLANLPDLATSPIIIEDLSVLAPGRHTVAPANLHAQIAPGKITALVGSSGSGKSTTTSVLLKLLAPTSGRILVGNTPLNDLPKNIWWNSITWVPQRPALLPGTVISNVLGNENGATEPTPQLTEAAKLTGFTEVLSHLPQGWHTRIGHGGTGLSVGQRQRLALTRALVAARPLVVLDEPTAHLDAATEQHILATLKRLKEKGHTVLVVAHRQALLSIADEIIQVHSKTTERKPILTDTNDTYSDTPAPPSRTELDKPTRESNHERASEVK